MSIRHRFVGAFSAALVAAVLLAASPARAQAAPPVTVNYSFDIPFANVVPNPCTNGFTLVSGNAHLAIGATTSSTGFELAVSLNGSGTGIDVSATGTPLVIGALPQYVYSSQFGADTTFPDGVPQYFERTLTSSDYLERDTLVATNDSYTMDTVFRLIFTNGLPSVPVLESINVRCE